MPDSVPPGVARSFTSLVPGLIIVAFFVIIDLLLKATGFSDVYQVILVILAEPLKHASNIFLGTILGVLFNSCMAYVEFMEGSS